jgi:hypothetical protein
MIIASGQMTAGSDFQKLIDLCSTEGADTMVAVG